MRWDTLILFFYVIFMSVLEHAAYDRLDKRIEALEGKPKSSISINKDVKPIKIPRLVPVRPTPNFPGQRYEYEGEHPYHP